LAGTRVRAKSGRRRRRCADHDGDERLAHEAKKSPGINQGFRGANPLGVGGGGHRVRTHLTNRLLTPPLGSVELFHEM
jgi:hypothetical protein